MKSMVFSGSEKEMSSEIVSYVNHHAKCNQLHGCAFIVRNGVDQNGHVVLEVSYFKETTLHEALSEEIKRLNGLLSEFAETIEAKEADIADLEFKLEAQIVTSI